MPKRVVMLLSNDFASDPRVEKEAVALLDAGHEVHVVAWNRRGSAPAEDERSGIRVHRVGPRTPHGGGMRNVSAYRRFWADASERAASLEPTVVHCHDADTVTPGLRVARSVRGSSTCRLVVDFHELYRDSKMVPQGGLVGAIARRAVASVERKAVRAADLVVVANPGTADYYGGLAPGARVLVVENAPDAGLFHPLPRNSTGEDFTVCFIGQKRYLGSLETLMNAVDGLEGVSALLAGGGVDAEAVERLAAGYENVRTEGHLEYRDIPSRYVGCDAVYAVNDARVGNMRVNFPVKAMEGMAMGLPVIVNSGTWIGDYVNEHGVGIAVDGEDLTAVREAIVRLRDDRVLAREMGARGRNIVEDGLNWEAAAGRLVAAYSQL